MKRLLVLLLILLPFAALAAETANPVGDAVAGLLNNVVFPFLSALLLGFVGVILNKVRQKFGLQVSAEQQAMLERAAVAGIAFAEEKAAVAVKQGLRKITGKEKLDLAIAHVLSAVPAVSPSQAETVVQSTLGRVFGAGATGTSVVTGV